MSIEACQGRSARIVRFLLLGASVGTLLTNAHALRFFEPTISRKSLALVLLGATAAFFWVARYGLPRPKKALPAALLGLVLIVAFALREWGTRSGLPQSYVADEYDTVHATLQMMKRGDFNPHWWYYPSLHRYVSIGTYLAVFFAGASGGRWESIQEVEVEDMLYWGRVLSAIAGTGTVLVTFLLGRALAGGEVGLMAAALLAVFPGAVEHSQFDKPDALMCYLAALSVLASLSYLKTGGAGRALLCGALTGLAVGAKYNAALVLIPFVLAVAFRYGRESLRRPDLYLGALATVSAFLLACPYALADFPRFLDHVAFDLWSYGFAGRPGAEGVDNWYQHGSYTFRYGTGPGALLVALFGLALALYRFDARWAAFLSFPVLHFAHYSAQRINWPDNLIPVYSFLAVLAAFGVKEAVKALSTVSARLARASPLLTSTALALLLWFPLTRSIRFDREATLPDTGNQARTWIEGALPPGTGFVVERHAPVPDPKRFKVLVESRVVNRSLEDYRRQGFEYLIVSSMVYERFEPSHRLSQAYARLFETTALVREFVPQPGKVGGPTLRILRIATPSKETAREPTRGRAPGSSDERSRPAPTGAAS